MMLERIPTQPRSKASVFLILSGTGTVLWLGGVAAGLLGHQTLGVALRVTAISLFASGAFFRYSLLVWTFLAMLGGVELGLDLPHFAAQMHFLGEVFLRLIRMIVAPLIFATITTGIAGQSQLRSIGRVALKALIFFEVVTTLGLIIGALAMTLSGAGWGIVLPATQVAPLGVQNMQTWQQVMVNLIPENIAQAVAQNQILQVAIFSVLFGAALALLPEQKRAPLISVLQSLADTMFKLTRFVMVLAPLAAGAALAYTVGSMGLASLLPLVKLVLTYYAALAAFCLLVMLPVLIGFRVPLGRFVAAVAEPAAIGFATTSSEAALPLAMERMEELGVPRWIVSFVIPTGYSFNLTGSTLYLAMAALFAVQAAGLHFSVGQQIVLLATLALTSKGIAGVPRATIVTLLAVAGSFQIPAAAVLMLLGVDTLMDMGRTALNVIGNCMAAAVVARWEGVLKPTAHPPSPLR